MVSQLPQAASIESKLNWFWKDELLNQLWKDELFEKWSLHVTIIIPLFRQWQSFAPMEQSTALTQVLIQLPNACVAHHLAAGSGTR